MSSRRIIMPAPARKAVGHHVKGNKAYVVISNRVSKYDLSEDTEDDGQGTEVMTAEDTITCIAHEHDGAVEGVDARGHVLKADLHAIRTDVLPVAMKYDKVESIASGSNTGMYLGGENGISMVDPRSGWSPVRSTERPHGVMFQPGALHVARDGSDGLTAVARSRNGVVVLSYDGELGSRREVRITEGKSTRSDRVWTACSHDGRYVAVSAQDMHVVDLKSSASFKCELPRAVTPERRLAGLSSLQAFVDPSRGAAFIAVWDAGIRCHWYMDKLDKQTLTVPCEDAETKHIVNGNSDLLVSNIVALMPHTDHENKLFGIGRTVEDRNICTLYELAWQGNNEDDEDDEDDPEDSEGPEEDAEDGEPATVFGRFVGMFR
jgi:hypothetical protein